ncbi:MAG: hypothetical protein IJZ85_08650 [Lachnospiraceae bacterium]|nr:hypothetical protein [Lachnospiraceae bacterium]
MEAKKVKCIWEHNGSDSLIYSGEHIGAFTRGSSKEIALSKMEQEIKSYLRWKNRNPDEVGATVSECDIGPDAELTTEIIQENSVDLNVADADSDVIFDEEKQPLSMEEYLELKHLALKSAEDFLRLYESIPDKDRSCLPERKTFYGAVPRTAREMYEHTKSVNSYYFGEIDVEADNEGTILACREAGFKALEKRENFLENPVIEGSYGEMWSLRKVLRRFIWHDRIHAKAMYRMAVKTFECEEITDVFRFEH